MPADTINELRKICQTPVKGKDGEFCDVWYRSVTVHLTKLFLRTPITANQVTVLSIISGALGGFFLIFSSNLLDIIGVLLLQFYWLLDFVDGEVARYRKSGSLTGEYLDFAAHYIVFPLFLIGMTFGAYKNIGEIWIFAFGFSAAISVGLQKDTTALVYWVICRERKDRIKKGIAGKKFNDILSENRCSFNEKTSSSGLKNKVKNYLENALPNSPRLKVSLPILLSLFTGNICSEMGIMLTVFAPAVADIWGGIEILGKPYRFMTLYLILLGGLYPILLIVRITKNIVRSMPDKEYQELFD